MAARQCAINHLSTLRGALGSLDKVDRIVKCESHLHIQTALGPACVRSLCVALHSTTRCLMPIACFPGLGMCNAAQSFTDSPSVINGYSELIKEVFGNEKGTGARSAIGVSALPLGFAVEVEAIYQLKSDYGSSKL